MMRSSSTLALGLGLAVALGGGCERDHRTALEDLSPGDRARLLEDALDRSPGVHQASWYEPAIGYTLVPDSALETWSDRFRSNEIGMRTHPVAKPTGTFRVVVVGDSWAYGMGVTGEQSFPALLEHLANEHAGTAAPVQVFTLALPGWNTLNELAALSYFAEALAPDALLFVPSSNDHFSLPEVLPNGSLHAGSSGTPDRFGDPHMVGYRTPGIVGSYRSLERWRIGLASLSREIGRWKDRGVPAGLLFVARFSEPMAHRLMADGGVRGVSHAVVPVELTLAPWLTELENPHGNARAQERYAALAYRVLAGPLGWTELPPAAVPVEVEGVEVLDDLPPTSQWRAESDAELAAVADRFLPESFRAGPGDHLEWAGPGDPVTGLVPRATTLLLRPPHGATGLRLELHAFDDAPSLSPLRVRASIPSPGGGSSSTVMLRSGVSASVAVEVALPTDRRPDAPVDVVLEADRAVASRSSLVPRSFVLESISVVDRGAG